MMDLTLRQLVKAVSEPRKLMKSFRDFLCGAFLVLHHLLLGCECQGCNHITLQSDLTESRLYGPSSATNLSTVECMSRFMFVMVSCFLRLVLSSSCLLCSNFGVKHVKVACKFKLDITLRKESYSRDLSIFCLLTLSSSASALTPSD
jgi:hypothetical protein